MHGRARIAKAGGLHQLRMLGAVFSARIAKTGDRFSQHVLELLFSYADLVMRFFNRYALQKTMIVSMRSDLEAACDIADLSFGHHVRAFAVFDRDIEGRI